MGCIADIECGKRTIIGIRDFEACSKPESGLWLNDLPGISLKTAARIAGEDTHTGAEVMNKCIKTSVKKVFERFQNYIAPEFDFNVVIETRQIDLYNSTIVPSANLERGLILKRWRSEAVKIYIEELYVKSTGSGVGTIKIYDGDTLAKEISVDVLSNEVITIPVRLKFEQETVKVVMNNLNFAMYSSDMNSFRIVDSCRSCGGYQEGRYIVKGWDGTQETNTGFGIGIKTSVRCYDEEIICSILPRAYFLIWYGAGIEFMKERIYSDRLNPLVSFTKEVAVELLNEYETEYDLTFKTLTSGLYKYLKSTKGECITCKPTFYGQFTP